MADQSKKLCTELGILMIDPDHSVFKTHTEKKKGGK